MSTENSNAIFLPHDDEDISVKNNKLIFFGVNILIMLQVLIKYFSIIGLFIFLSEVAVFYYFWVIRKKTRLPISADLTTLVFFDFLVFLSLNYKIIVSGFSIDGVTDFFSLFFDNTIYIKLFLCACVIGFLGMKYTSITWLTGISGAIFGLIAILCCGTDYYDGTFEFYEVTKPFIVLFFICVAIWTAFLTISICIDSSKRKNNIRLGIIMLVTFIILIITSIDIVSRVARDFYTIFFELSTKVLPMWKTLLICFVLIGCSIVILCYNENNKKNSRIDAYIVVTIALFVFLTKLTLINYNPYNILLFIILFIVTIVYLNNEIQDRKTFGFTMESLLAIEFVGIIVAIFLFKIGCWECLIISAVCLMLWRSIDWNVYRYTKYPWYGIITALCIETLALQWKLKFSIPNVLSLLMIYMMGISTVFIINYSYKRVENTGSVNEGLSDKYMRMTKRHINYGMAESVFQINIIVCTCIMLLCLASIRNKMKVSFNIDKNNKSVDISTSIKGKRNSIESISYVWMDYRGKTVNDEESIDTSGGNLYIMSDLLKVKAVDNKGVISTYYKWFPYWLYLDN